jgi:hypothetical protein
MPCKINVPHLKSTSLLPIAHPLYEEIDRGTYERIVSRIHTSHPLYEEIDRGTYERIVSRIHTSHPLVR